MHSMCYAFFFFNDTATTEIYTLSLHDALPIFHPFGARPVALDGDGLEARLPDQLLADPGALAVIFVGPMGVLPQDRKSTRLNSSHANISYAVFCLKKKK